MSNSIPQFAIIGASPSGFTLVLSLLQHMPSLQPNDIHIFETNPPHRHPGGPFSLTPNALRILSKVNINGTSAYEKIKDLGFHQVHHNMRSDSGQFLGSLPMGGKERWCFDALRIERGDVLKVLEAEIQRLGVPVHYDCSLREILPEDEDGVSFVIRRGGIPETIRAKRLIGADGVHSRTRSFVCGKEVKPVYSGNFMAASYVPFTALDWGAEFAEAKAHKEYSLSITGSQGTLLLIPADVDVTRMQVGRQWAGPERDRQSWEDLASDKAALLQLFQADQDYWSTLPRSVLASIKEDDIWGVWPFYALPPLERWVSPRHKVVIVGDAAHTVVPAAAQGATQAIEDAWSLARAFAAARTDERESLREWQSQRMARLARISQLSIQLMNIRLPPEERAQLAPELVFDLCGSKKEREQRLDWLYGHES